MEDGVWGKSQKKSMVCKHYVKNEIELGMQFMSSRKALEASLIQQCSENKNSPCNEQLQQVYSCCCTVFEKKESISRNDCPRGSELIGSSPSSGLSACWPVHLLLPINFSSVNDQSSTSKEMLKTTAALTFQCLNTGNGPLIYTITTLDKALL